MTIAAEDVTKISRYSMGKSDDAIECTKIVKALSINCKRIYTNDTDMDRRKGGKRKQRGDAEFDDYTRALLENIPWSDADFRKTLYWKEYPTSERHFDSVESEYSKYSMSNRGFVKPYVSMGSSSQIRDLSSNIRIFDEPKK